MGGDWLISLLLGGLLGSVVALGVATFIKKRSYVQSGVIHLNSDPPHDYSVRYVTKYKELPNLEIERGEVLDEEYDSKLECVVATHQVYNVVIKEERLDGFRFEVIPNVYRDSTDEDEVYRIPGEAEVEWRAEGFVDRERDARSPWLQLSLTQQVFSVSGLLFAVGLFADLLGILGFIRG